jgi:predicted RNA-binding protein
MCQTNAFALGAEKDDMLMEGVSRIEVDGDMLKLRGVFGERLEVKGRIREVNFQGGRLVIERL